MSTEEKDDDMSTPTLEAPPAKPRKNAEGVMTSVQAAARLGVDRVLVNDWIAEGRFKNYPGVWIGRATVPNQLTEHAVVAFGKATGYLDREGRIVAGAGGGENAGARGHGRWSPAEPTVCPTSGRERLYLDHLPPLYGVQKKTLDTWRWLSEPTAKPGTKKLQNVHKRMLANPFPQARRDEFNRPFWFLEDLEAWDGKKMV